MLEITVTYLEIPLSFVEKGMTRMVKGTCVSLRLLLTLGFQIIQ